MIRISFIWDCCAFGRLIGVQKSHMKRGRPQILLAFLVVHRFIQHTVVMNAVSITHGIFDSQAPAVVASRSGWGQWLRGGRFAATDFEIMELETLIPAA